MNLNISLNLFKRIYSYLILISILNMLFATNILAQDSSSTNSQNQPKPVLMKEAPVLATSADFTNSINNNSNLLVPNNTNQLQIATLMNRARHYVSQNNYQKAEIFYNKVLVLNPVNTDALYNLGIIAEDEQNYPKALHFFEEALKSNPNDNGCINEIAKVKTLLGNTKSSRFRISSNQLPIETFNSQNNAPVYGYYNPPKKHPILTAVGRDMGKALRFGAYAAGAVAGGVLSGGFDPCACYW